MIFEKNLNPIGSRNKMADFTDDEISKMIIDGIEHYNNPRHMASKLPNESLSIAHEMLCWGLIEESEEDVYRYKRLYKEVKEFLEEPAFRGKNKIL